MLAGVLIQQQNGRGQGTGLICGDSLTIYDLSSSILYAESKLTMHSSGFHSILHCCRDFRPSYLGINHNVFVFVLMDQSRVQSGQTSIMWLQFLSLCQSAHGPQTLYQTIDSYICPGHAISKAK